MSKRLGVLLEWVRQALRSARRAEPEGDPKKKLEVVRSAARHSFPTADIEQMTERGYARDVS